jgi:mRNA-degrading endonuclease toxin of MazEF toxin-antitoxin module
LSYRFNIGPIIKTVNIEKDKSMNSKQLEKEVEECNDDDINAVKSKLKKYKEIWG